MTSIGRVGAVALVLAAVFGCDSKLVCRPGTMWVALTFDGAARGADRLRVHVTTNGSSRVTEVPYHGGDTLQVFFPDGGYPTGASTTVLIEALAGDTVLSAATRPPFELPAGCVSLPLSFGTGRFSVGGTVSGLTGSGLVLQDNGGDDLPVSANGAFTFVTRVTSGQTYAVTVKTQPSGPAQTCDVVNGSGAIGGSDVTTVQVTCGPPRYRVLASVSGLAGSGLVLQDNGGDDLAVSGNGTIAFATAITTGQTYAVAVKTQPTGPSQTCVVAEPAGGTVDSADVTVKVTCTTNRYLVHANVGGLAGRGLVLQDNGGDDLPVSGNGTVAFATAIASGLTFAVTVKTQPTSPSQTCTVAAPASGTIGAGDETVAVTCATNRYRVGVSVSGLAGSGLVLQDNGGDDLPVSADGAYTFATPIASGLTFAVTVKTQPTSPSQTCVVANGSGTVDSADVAAKVTCTTNRYLVHASVSGLAGSGLVLQDNGGDNLPVGANGVATFATAIVSGQTYRVSVLTQPTAPWQTCAVAKPDSGTVGTGDVTVTVTCTTNKYTIGGALTGFSGAGVVLQDNGGDDLAVPPSGTFTFATAVASGQSYAVTVKTQPSGYYCRVSNGSGVVAGANVTNVSVVCKPQCGRFTVGGVMSQWAPRNTSVVTPASSQPGFSDLSPPGVFGFYSIAGANLFVYSTANATFTQVPQAAPVAFSNWAGPAWIASKLYFLFNGGAYVYDTAGVAWSTLATGLPATVNNNNAHDVDGNVYTIDNAGRVIQFTPANNSWRELTPSIALGSISEPRIAYDTCSKLLYLVPNFNAAQVYSFDPATSTAKALAVMPAGQVINDAFCADGSGHLYAAGAASGMQFLQYNITDDQWVMLPAPPIGVDFNGSCTVADDGNLYFAGAANKELIHLPLQ